MNRQVNTSINEELHKKAKDKGLNVSNVLEEALRCRLRPDTSDVDQSQIMFKCSQCGKVVEYAYICSYSKEVWCVDCEKSNKYCTYMIKEYVEKNSNKYHEHHRIPKLDGSVDDKLYKEVKLEQYRKDNSSN